MGVRMPQMNGIEATTRLVLGGSRARMLTTFNLDEYIYHALKAGASAFMFKDASREHLTGAVRGSRQQDPPRSRYHPAADRGLLRRPRARFR